MKTSKIKQRRAFLDAILRAERKSLPFRSPDALENILRSRKRVVTVIQRTIEPYVMKSFTFRLGLSSHGIGEPSLGVGELGPWRRYRTPCSRDLRPRRRPRNALASTPWPGLWTLASGPRTFGVGTSDIGVGTSDHCVGTSDLGIGEPSLGVGTSDLGFGTALCWR